MCKAINDLMEEKLIEGKCEGIIEGKNSILVDLVKEGLVSIDIGAMKAGVSVDVFKSWISR